MDEQGTVDIGTARQFVSVLSSAFNSFDNSYATDDMYAASPTRQYVSVGPRGTSIEGSTTVLTTTQQGGLVISPTLVLIAIGFAAAMLWKR